MNRKRRKRRRKAMTHRQKVVARQKRILGGIAVLVFILIAAVCFWGKPGSEKEIETANVYPETEGEVGDEAAAGLSESQGNDADTNLTNNTGNTLHTAGGQEIDWQEMESEPGTTEITVSLVGDCTIGTDITFDQSTSFVAKYNEVQNPSYFFEEVRDIFEADDLTVINMEGALTDSNERVDKTYAFRGSPAYVQILTSGSVEAANVANNHSKDYGTQGFEDTVQYLEAAGIRTFGYDNVAIMDVKGVKVGLIGIYELPDGLGRQQQVIDTIAKAKEEGAQIIIVSFHWGTEKEFYPDDIQKTLGRLAIDEGADLVVGHHPHVLQGIEEYNGKNIVYSLGNFCFGGNSNPSVKDTMIFQQTFTVEDGVKVEDNRKNIIPCSLTSSAYRNNYQPIPLEGEEKERVLQDLEEYSSIF